MLNSATFILIFVRVFYFYYSYWWASISSYSVLFLSSFTLCSWSALRSIIYLWTLSKWCSSICLLDIFCPKIIFFPNFSCLTLLCSSSVADCKFKPISRMLRNFVFLAWGLGFEACLWWVVTVPTVVAFRAILGVTTETLEILSP